MSLFLLPHTGTHNLNCWVIFKSSLMYFAIISTEVSPQPDWELSWACWPWGKLSLSWGQTRNCWRIFLSLILPFLKLWLEIFLKKRRRRKTYLSSSRRRAEEWSYFPYPSSPLAVVAGSPKRCLWFSVALQHWCVARCSKFGSEWVCGWKASLMYCMWLSWSGIKWVDSVFLHWESKANIFFSNKWDLWDLSSRMNENRSQKWTIAPTDLDTSSVSLFLFPQREQRRGHGSKLKAVSFALLTVD